MSTSSLKVRVTLQCLFPLPKLSGSILSFTCKSIMYFTNSKCHDYIVKYTRSSFRRDPRLVGSKCKSLSETLDDTPKWYLYTIVLITILDDIPYFLLTWNFQFPLFLMKSNFPSRVCPSFNQFEQKNICYTK